MSVPCIHGSRDYRRCRACQNLLTHREALAFSRRREEARRERESTPELTKPAGQPASPATIQAARQSAAQAMQRAKAADEKRRAAARQRAIDSELLKAIYHDIARTK